MMTLIIALGLPILALTFVEVRNALSRKTNPYVWPRRVGFYLLSLVVAALFGWDEGAIGLAGLAGGIALIGWWIAGLGWVAIPADKLDGEFPENEDLNPAYSISLSNAFHDDSE